MKKQSSVLNAPKKVESTTSVPSKLSAAQEELMRQLLQMSAEDTKNDEKKNDEVFDEKASSLLGPRGTTRQSVFENRKRPPI